MNYKRSHNRIAGSARFFRFLLEKLLSHPFAEDVVEDLFDIYQERREEGPLRARLWLIQQCTATIFTVLKKMAREFDYV